MNKFGRHALVSFLLLADVNKDVKSEPEMRQTVYTASAQIYLYLISCSIYLHAAG